MPHDVRGGGDGEVRVPSHGPRAEEEAGSAWRLHNWRVRSRLVALILVPTAAAVLLGGVQVVSSISAAADYQRVNDLARLSERISALTHELAEERAQVAWYIALGQPERMTAPLRDQMDKANNAVKSVRESAADVREGASGRAKDEVEAALNRLEDLAALRGQVLESKLLPDAAIGAYSQVIGDLLSLHDEIGKGSADDVLFAQSMTLTSLAGAKESAALQQALVTAVLVNGHFEQQQQEDFLGAMSREENELQRYAAEATRDERRFFDETVKGRVSERAQFLRELILIRTNIGVSLKGLDQTKRDDAREWSQAMGAVVERMRTVELRHTRAIVSRSESLTGAERGQALVAAGAVGALLLAVLLITSGVARSLIRPLRRLRSEALQIADERLPGFVQRVRETRETEIAIEVPPIGVFSRDEVGEVARAFDEVHREAVRLAGDEARLRGNINAMFVNLSRRSQTLVERQLTLIERLEKGERDDKRLADLFKLDHLATRMRRNSENLLVLAGQEAARRWSQPVELMDVIRASLSEVESYDRVHAHMQAEVAIAGQAVSDVVHLLAELVENAVSFSPRETRVTVSSNRIEGGGVMLSVADQGIGMTSEEQAHANWRLANPPVVDVSVSRRMGLFVVGRLALRHGVRVQLRPQENGGLTAMVLIPEKLVAPIPGSATYAQPQAAMFPTVNPPAGGSAYPGPGHPSGGYQMPALADPPPRTPLPPGVSPIVPPQARPAGAVGPYGPAGDTPPPGPALPRRKPPLGAPPMAPPAPGSTGPTALGDLGGKSWFASSGPPPERPLSAPVSMAHEPYPPPDASPLFPPVDVGPNPYAGVKPYGIGELDPTGPMPRVDASGFDPTGDDYLPIFAAVESDWFKKSAARSAPGGETESAGDTAQDAWQSPADEGWRAAEAASAPSLGGLTASGLPKRTPRANLVPGSVAPGAGPPAPVAVPKPSPDHVRDRLSSFQQGVRRARAEAAESGPAEAVEEEP
ncbi:Signal transduction histidine kinase [Sinosporangium album]|uniref:histidine kinase n=1 Tax=Sinosporangium album TaxID=504805 RepID=A0A1G7VCA7_9ACTN|nr:nitrate- and nitrite sensing domain-containing protein [Sinosporangium album]SDG56979.1 Signal transduction histidine kinase [Sinosporangium album]